MNLMKIYDATVAGKAKNSSCNFLVMELEKKRTKISISHWKFRRRTFPPARKELAPTRVKALPIFSIGAHLRALTNAMNAILPSDNFDSVLTTTLYYAVMCLRRFFPEWGVYMRPYYFITCNPLDRISDQGVSDLDNDYETEPLITDV